MGTLVLALSLGLSGSVQDATPLPLEAAIALALEKSPSMAASAAAADAAEARVDGARSKLLPRLDYVESFQRSDNPVFVFGTLLNQGQFSEENFDVDRLNDPDTLNNYKSAFLVRQTLFAGGANRLELSRARYGRDAAREKARQAEMRVIFEVVRAYFAVEVAGRNLEVLEDGVAAAREDVRRAQALFETGLATEADLLSIQVQGAHLEEQRIQASNLVAIRRAELNDRIGEPLERAFALATPLTPGEPAEGGELSALEELALVKSPEIRQARLDIDSASIGQKQARSAFLPSLDLQAGWESDRESFAGAGATNWMLGLSLRMNLFNGLGDRARLAEAEASLREIRAREREIENGVRLAVRRAFLDRAAARERLRVAEKAALQARESHRITRARYENGLATVTELLRSGNSLLLAEVHHLSAVFDARLAGAALELATGTLKPDSEAIQP
jgi:outer membrane protein TolC